MPTLTTLPETIAPTANRLEAQAALSGETYYPESDGKPMADNTLQARWMTYFYANLELLYKDDPNVFVAVDLLWYPVEGDPKITLAPDVMVALGRPRGERGSYQQWRENGVAPQVVFEILSPSNSVSEMFNKSVFYQKHGVREFYLYEPFAGSFEAVLFDGDGTMHVVPVASEWTSPLLGIRFEPQPRADLLVYFPDNEPFMSLKEASDLITFRTQERNQERERANLERERADRETRRAQVEAQRADAETQRADEQAQRADTEAQARQAAEAEIARLRALLGETTTG